MSKTRLLTSVAALAGGFALALGPATASAQEIVGLITKTNTNPFFVKMKEGAEAKAAELGMELRSYAGKYDGDNEGQVEAIESLIAAGAKGILITPSDSAAIVPTVERARDAGVLVIALDTQLEPPDAADATFATDNFKAGELIGQWAAAKLGDEAADAKIAMLDLSEAGVSVDVQRDQGFLTGFGMEVGDPNRIGDEDDARIVGHDITQGAEEGGRTAMENLLQRDPGVSVVCTINEPAAAGLRGAALVRPRGAGADRLDRWWLPGGPERGRRRIGATSMQFPLVMAAMGVEAVKQFAETGEKPETPEGQEFVDTGVELVTDNPVEGIPSITSAEALEKCWG